MEQPTVFALDAVASREPAAPAHLDPPLKWAGGKRWLVPRLRPLWEPHRGRRLVEPFVGGMAVALGLVPAGALLNDINPHLTNFYRWVQRGLVIDRPMRNDAAHFYAERDRFNALIRGGRAAGAEAAGLFYFLNRAGYNGLCRFNRHGGFNTPFGRYATITFRRDFADYAAVLAPWRLTCGDFADVPLDGSEFVYADSPYDGTFSGYSAAGFTWADQERLAAWLARHPGPVVASNAATPRVIDLYRGLNFALTYLDAPRRISARGDRAPARELLATRNL